MTVSATEKLQDLFAERAIDLLRLEIGTRNKVYALLKQLESDIAKSLKDIDPGEPVRAAFRRARLAKLMKAVQSAIKATYRGVDTLLARELREIVDIEATWTGRAINSATHATFVDAGLTRNFVETIAGDVLIQGAPTAEWWSRQAAGLANRFADEMRRGMALGEPLSALIDRTTGLMDISRNGAERIVRSSVQTAANAARQATYRQNKDLIAAEQWSATLDTRTSTWCIVRDGLNYKPDTHEPIGHDVPWLEGPGALHWNCRSTSIPVLKSWRELGIDLDEISENTRASMDGQVPHDLSFEDWLKKQSTERQDTVLGAVRAAMWRDGKISFRDLLDQNGRPLTTEDLRAQFG